MYEVLSKLRVPDELVDVRARERCIEALLEAHARINLEWLREHPETPLLYQSGVRYRDDSHKRYDEWCDIPTTLTRQHGDCDDLVPWRIAELRFRGLKARGMARYQHAGGATYHVLVRMPDGTTEDPSQILGMRI